MVSLHRSNRPSMRSPSPPRRPRSAVSDLDHDEQSELALKRRYGIGFEQLGFASLPPGPPTPAGPPPKAPAAPDVPPRAPRSDADVRSRASALGVTAGRRGQWLRR